MARPRKRSGVNECCHVPVPHHRPWCDNYEGPVTVECPLHGTMPAAHRCGESPMDHACGVSLHPNYDPEVGHDDQGVSHDEWSSTQGEKLHRISNMHVKVQGEGGMSDGTCAECWHPWPCPTYHVAAGWGLDSFYDCEDEGWCSHAEVKW
jgi:hypothetical protein